MILERFSLEAQDAIERACRLAVKKEHASVSPWHLLTGILDRKEKSLNFAFQQQNIDTQKLAVGVDSKLLGLPKAAADAKDTPVSRELEKVFIAADDYANQEDAKYISVDHLLFSLLDQKEVSECFKEAGADSSKVKDTLKNAPAMAGADATAEFELLSKFTTDLTARAANGELDPVIGREEEVRKVIQILCRRMKNNPLLIGEPGVGKTAIMEGLAQRIVAGLVPDHLKTASILSVDMGQLVAGTKFRGEFEERLKRLLDEVRMAPNVILFIDEIHLLVGAGKTDGAMDASNLIKPALARGEIRCMGATTLGEYRAHIEKDQALTRRFQTVQADEPSFDETLSILRGIKQKYEAHHGVRILDTSLQAAVRLSKRYISDRFLPDKAIDLIDETSAHVRLQLASKPPEIAELDQQLIQMEIEINALEGETLPASEERLAELKTQRAAAKEKCDALTEKWQKEKNAVTEIQEAQNKLEEAKREMDIKVRDEDFSRVAELQYKEIPKWEEKLKEFEAIEIKDEAGAEVVTEDHIAHTIAEWTGIPASRMLSDEKQRLQHLEDHLRKRVIGQDKALETIAKAVRRSRAGLQDPNRPIASFLMPGPTGVGKTETAKALADFIFNDENAMVRLDMSEFMEKHTVARLVGAPPGYVGFDEGGLLTNKVKRKPFSVVLFDEVEKAHPDVFNLLLQLLDDGRLTDSAGVTVNFANTIILLTSNLGADFIADQDTEEAIREMQMNVMEKVRDHFRPEFINRLDDVILFRQLTRSTMRPILDVQLGKLQKMLDEKDIEMNVNEGAKEYLADTGFSPAYGARPLRRVIQTELQDLLADAVISGEINNNSKVYISLRDGRLAIVDKEEWSNPPKSDIIAEDEDEETDVSQQNEE
ncbi:MAG: AAA family ATPase [Lentisphaerales bacterium]|nr:AAA family ATPase [Lentisphaerales bacterium]